MKKIWEKQTTKICVFSGKRGGFGAYLPLMRLIEKDKNLKLQIILGDMHGAKLFGGTAKEAKKFFPRASVDVLSMGSGRGDTPVIRVENLGTCLFKAGRLLKRLAPDILMVHADRGEHLVMALAAVNLGIAVSHTQGGEVSGNIDDIERHATTKLSHLHFPETKKAHERILSLGEEPWRIHTVGSLYVDRIVNRLYTPPSRAQLAYGLEKGEPYYIALLHPDTYLSREENYQAMRNLLRTLKNSGLRSIVIYPCSDPGYEGILKAIDEVRNDSQFLIHKNIDNLDFLGLLAGCRALIGNSSAAYVEAPYLKIPAINIGGRQKGRDREGNVVDTPATVTSIGKTLLYVLNNKHFRKRLAKGGSRLGNGTASLKIIKILKNVALDEKLFRKHLAVR